MPAQRRPCPGRAQHSKRDDHREDQAKLLDDLARMLQGVDEEAEYEARHDRQKWLVELLGQRVQAEHQTGEIHQRHQHQTGQRAPREAMDQRGAAVHRDHFTLFYRRMVRGSPFAPPRSSTPHDIAA